MFQILPLPFLCTALTRSFHFSGVFQKGFIPKWTACWEAINNKHPSQRSRRHSTRGPLFPVACGGSAPEQIYHHTYSSYLFMRKYQRGSTWSILVPTYVEWTGLKSMRENGSFVGSGRNILLKVSSLKIPSAHSNKNNGVKW